MITGLGTGVVISDGAVVGSDCIALAERLTNADSRVFLVPVATTVAVVDDGEVAERTATGILLLGALSGSVFA